MQRIHIVGFGPRTGTTLLAEMMVNSFDIDLHTKHESRIAKSPLRNGNVFLTKSPKDILVVEPVLKFVKKLHVICMLRDPRDMIVSKHGRDKDRYWSNLQYWNNYLPFYESLSGHPRFLSLRYEDLVSQPDEVQETIISKMPFLKKMHRFSEYHKTAKPSSESLLALRELRPVSTGSVGNWRKHKERVMGQILEHGSLNNDLIKFGYEKDDSWEKELEGVVPDRKESHPSPFYEMKFIRKKQRGRNFRAWRVWLCHTSLYLGIREIIYRLFK